MSNSSEFSSFEPKLQDQQNEALLRNADTQKRELERLQILNERLHGQGCKRLSRSELQSLESQLCQGLRIVEGQVAKKRIKLEEDERVIIKEGSEEDEHMRRELVEKERDENLRQQLILSKKRKTLRLMARDMRRWPEETKHEQNHVALLQSIESMKREIKRLELLNKRMSGKELDGLNYFELVILQREIQYGKFYMKGRKVNKKIDEMWYKENRGSRLIVPVAEQEQSSMDDDTEDHKSNISSRLRSLRIN